MKPKSIHYIHIPNFGRHYSSGKPIFWNCDFRKPNNILGTATD